MENFDSDGVREEERGAIRNGDARLGGGKELSPQIHYFAKPNSTTIRTVLVVIFYHMFPFTGLPNLGLVFVPFYLYKRSAYIELTVYLGLMLLLLAVPPYYSKNVRRKVRSLYEELAVYLPSAKFIIVPTEPLPEDKGYIFAIHPHGRMFYSNALFSHLHEIWRAPLKLTHGDFFQTAAGGFFDVPIARNWFYLIGVMPASKKNIVDKLRNKNHVLNLYSGTSGEYQWFRRKVLSDSSSVGSMVDFMVRKLPNTSWSFLEYKRVLELAICAARFHFSFPNLAPRSSELNILSPK